jgi:large subunit ribosomal protein L25
MQIEQLAAEKREPHGTRSARRLRKEGKLPGIVYGHGQTPEPVTIPVRELNTLLEHGAHLVELKVNGSAQQCLIKDVQFDHLGIMPVHVDFARVDLHERVKVRVPFEFRGTPVGVQEGGLLDHDMVDMEIECLVTEIPESIRVNVANLKLGQALHVRELELPESVKAMASPEAIVASVRAKAAEVEAAAPTEEAATQPEIIGRKEKVEEGEEEPKEKEKEKK